MNADQIYTYLMKLKLNKCIGAYSNCRKYFFMVTKNKCFHFLVYKKSSLS